MGAQGLEASPTVIVPQGGRGMYVWRHLVSWVVEACPVNVCVSMVRMHAWLEASCLMGGRGSQASQGMFLSRGARGIHEGRPLVSWVVEPRRPIEACSCPEVLEACMVAAIVFQCMFVSRGARGMHGCRHLVSQVVEPRRPLKPFKCLEVLEACIVGGILSHGWSKVAGLSSHGCASRCSRHAWLEASCLMGGRGSQASQFMFLS